MKNPLFLFFFFLVLLLSCAQVKQLKGGNKDTKPPQVLAMLPPDLSTNFNSESIVISFDEYVQLNNIGQELLISPPMKRAPKVLLKKKSVVITFQEELRPNTTYTLNFGDGIADNNENNKAKDLVYVFSTGEAIDSLNLSGTVVDALTSSPSKQFKVMLFESDTGVFSKKQLPVYFAKTKDNGVFEINHLHKGNYYLYAIDDINSNYHWEDGEAIAFLDSTVTPAFNDSTLIALRSSVPRTLVPFVSDYKTDSTGVLHFMWNSFFTGIECLSLNKDLQVKKNWNLSEDSLYFHLMGQPTERVEKLVIRLDTLLNDTLEIPFFRSALMKPFAIANSLSKTIKRNEEIYLLPAQYAQLKDSSKVFIELDSLRMGCSLSASDQKFRIKSNLSAGNAYKLLVLPGAFLNQTGATNDTLIQSFSVYKTDDLGSVSFEISGLVEPDNYIFQLFDKNQNVTEEILFGNNRTITVADLTPGEYSARIILDDNKNGFFDPGIPLKSIAPETCYSLGTTLRIRANWEIQQPWLVRVN
jgi:uncharacterized protein (DUF2141 family)